MKKICVGILGLGTVGSGVVNLLDEQRELIKRRLGVEVCVSRIADRSVFTKKKTARGVSPENMGTDFEAVIDAPEVHVIAELIGGTDDARRHILRAIERKKPVVTANKAVLAVHGEEIFAAAEKAGCPLGFEASVAGGIPIVRNLREAFAADKIERLAGILNGTCNYILSCMTEMGADFGETLKSAQELGYAEADPAFDIDGVDASHKIAILANLAYGTPVDVEEYHTEGIRHITSVDIDIAKELGYRIKLVAMAQEREGKLDIRVHPMMLPESHPLSQVGGVYNAVAVSGVNAGPQVFIGKGAGSEATASAVVGDIIEVARWLKNGGDSRIPAAAFLPDQRARLDILAPREITTRFYVRFAALDKPGVLSRISGVFGEHDISLETVVQKGRAGEDGYARLVLLTHKATEENMQNALGEISRLDVVQPTYALVRVESDGMAFM